jgi:hypothetical protein
MPQVKAKIMKRFDYRTVIFTGGAHGLGGRLVPQQERAETAAA